MELVLENISKEGYLRRPLNQKESSKINKMCCCSSHVPHDESQKFLLFGDDAADKQIIFDSSNPANSDKNDNQISNNFGEKNLYFWRVKTSHQHWLFERNLEVHQIVDFLFA
jgi:hypothetical protein